MSSEIFLDQVEQNLVSLISEKKYRLAHDKCLSWIQKFPDEDRFIKLKERIEEEVEDENEEYVDSQITKGKELIDKEKFAEAIKTLKPLLKLTKNTSKIVSLIEKAQEGYKFEAEKAQREFEKIQRERLDKMFTEDPEMLLSQLFMLERENPGNKIVLKLTKEYRSKVIKKKISEKSELIRSGKYDDINHFISELQKIEKDDPQITEVQNRIKIRQHDNQVNEQKEHLYESQKQLVTLMQLKKFSKAIKVAEEILEIAPSNKEVESVLKKAKADFFRQTKEETAEKIENNLPALQTEYESNKDAFVRI